MSGVPLRDRAKQRIGTVLKDKWRLDALLGVGGTAAVYAGTHRNGKVAAVKVLRPELAGHEEIVTRFLREGYVANKINHRGVVEVIDDDRADDGSVFLVMELLQGTSLENYSRGGERLPIAESLRVVDELLDVLTRAHPLGIVHRDIKPANIFLTTAGQVKVLDFGIARLVESADHAHTQTGTAIGTPGYMPPEQARGRWNLVDGRTDHAHTQTGTAIGTPGYMPPEQARGRWNLVDGRTDLWAAGATLYALLAGHRPRRAETVQEELLLAMTQPIPSIALAVPSLHPALISFVDKSLSFEMDARFPDAAAMKAALEEVRSQLREGNPASLGGWDTGREVFNGHSFPPPAPSRPSLSGSSSGAFPAREAEPGSISGASGPGSISISHVGPPSFATGGPMMVSQPPPEAAPRSGNGLLIAVGVGALLVVGIGGTVVVRALAAKPPVAAASGTASLQPASLAPSSLAAPSVSPAPTVSQMAPSTPAVVPSAAPSTPTQATQVPGTSTKKPPTNSGKPTKPVDPLDMGPH
jgi:serine/threonine-protein kinase